MTKIAVVTGCAGFIGSYFVTKLLESGWYVYGIDKLTYVANTNYIRKLTNKYSDTFKLIYEDISTISWLPECDVIFNFAAESDVDNSAKDCHSFVKSNIQGVQNLLSIINNKVVIRADKPLFFQISTDEVYGDITNGSYNEDSYLNPSNPYAATKAAADLLVQSWARTHGLEYIIVRPSNNYGPNQYPEKLIPLAIKRLQRNKKIKLHNNGTPVRTWTHVADTVEAILTIYSKGKRNAIYNISSEFECTNKEIVELIINSYFQIVDDYAQFIDLSYNRPGQDIRYSISCEPLKNLGWSPKINFHKEVKNLVSTYQHKGIVW
jgi:dTDP-glucose 4,6-dehydratase